ncbi:hypothetical protein C8R45DRAFT_1098150 [Mycena sanguinolenta]|nr:hypothetical protein C8R45DRAFT_1098150 [Mycena sanguinolenta]
MLPFAVKVVWFIATICGEQAFTVKRSEDLMRPIQGTIFSSLSLMALGRLVGTWAPLNYTIGLVIYQGMFCLGMIWRMDPFRMPKAFCFAQTVGMSVGVYMIGGCCIALCIGTSLHILKPKQWGDISTSFKWRPVYYLPVIGFPLVCTAIRVVLLVKYHAVQPFEGLHCDAAYPLLVRIEGEVLPTAILLVPTLYLAAYSVVHVISTFKHVKRARQDDSELPRQIRRSRQNRYPFKQSGPVDDIPPYRQRIDPPPAREEATRQLNFHLPFFRNSQSITQLSPPLPQNSSPVPWDDIDERSSIASSSFPTFAPLESPKRGHPTGQAHGNDTETDIADGSRTWIDEDSCAHTSEGHEAPLTLEVDIKNQDDDDGATYRLSYRESSYRENTPSRVSHIHSISLLTPQIRRLLIFQMLLSLLSFTLRTLIVSVSSVFPAMSMISGACLVADALTHRDVPRPIGYTDFIQISVAWTGTIVFGTLPNIREEIYHLFRRR